MFSATGPTAGLTLDDVDLDRRTLTVAGRRRPLDQLTRDAVTSYLAYRTRRWPLTANWHLLLSQLSALQDDLVSAWWISERITRWNSTLTRLRQDHILEEAAAAGTRDPMHLASMFGLHPTLPSGTSTPPTDATTRRPRAHRAE
jgi:hypothetical protein